MSTIPSKLHQFWCNLQQDDTPPEDVSEVMARTRRLFAGHQYELWNTKKIEGLLEERMPKRLRLFSTLSFPAMKSDIARLLVLYEFGGLYLDATITPLEESSVTRYESLVGNLSLLVFESVDSPHIVTNQVISAESGSEHIRRVLETCCKNIEQSIERGDQSVDVWGVAGSQLSVYLNQSENEIHDYKRLTSNEALTLFTRYSCNYKQNPLGCWKELQKGIYLPVYRSHA